MQDPDNLFRVNQEHPTGGVDGVRGRELLSSDIETLEPTRNQGTQMLNLLPILLSVAAQPAAGEYVILPVRISVSWTGRSGDRVLSFNTILINRTP